MRIFSKKAFAIGPGAQQGTDEINSFITVPGAFQEMPDQYANDPTFKLAVKAGDITVVANSAQQAEIERHEADKGTGTQEDAPVQTPLQAFYEELKMMKQDEVTALAEKYNVTPKNGEKLKELKKRVFEAYKLANPEEKEAGDEDGTDEETAEE